jgi:NH3-dependent NAD+ synthetase
MKRVVVAISGGVDSSVTTALSWEQGYDVVGMMLRLLLESGKEASNRCCTPDSMALARRVAACPVIKFYVIDASEIFRQTVVEFFWRLPLWADSQSLPDLQSADSLGFSPAPCADDWNGATAGGGSHQGSPTCSMC